jgi:predicted Fe-Mo cluster-binding NifX family protein
MKICIPSSGPEPGDLIDDRFARAPYFIIHDTDSEKTESLRNDAAGGAGGVGPKAAQFLIRHGVDMVVTGRVGGNALEALKAGGIKVYLYEGGGSVREALSAALSGDLKEQ